MKIVLATLLCFGLFPYKSDTGAGLAPELLQRHLDLSSIKYQQDSLFEQYLLSQKSAFLVDWLALEILQGRSSSAMQVLESLRNKSDVAGLASYHACLAWAHQSKAAFHKALPYAEKTLLLNPNWCDGHGSFWVNYLATRANPMALPEQFLGLNAEVNLKDKRQTQGNEAQLVVWNKLRIALFQFLNRHWHVFLPNDPWKAWLCQDLGDLHFLCNYPNEAKAWWNLAAKLDPKLLPNIQERLDVVSSNSPWKFSWWKGVFSALILGGLIWWSVLSASLRKSGK